MKTILQLILFAILSASFITIAQGQNIVLKQVHETGIYKKGQKIRVTLETLPLVFEGGVPHFLASINAETLWNQISELCPWEQGFFEQKLVDRIKPFVRDDKIIYWAAAYIVVATA